MSGSVFLLTKEQVPENWSKVEKFIQDGLDTSDMGLLTTDYLKERCEAGVYGLWIYIVENEIKAAAVLALETYPRAKVVTVISVGGYDMKEWNRKFFGRIEEFAKEMGCKYVMAAGRKGWSRAIEGVKPSATIWYKEI